MNVDYKLHPQIADLQRHPISINGDADLKFQIVDWYAQDTGDESCKKEMERARLEAEEDAEEGGGGEGGEKGSDRCNFRDPRKYEINMFGVTKEGHSVCCKVQDYKPFFYLKLPEDRPETVATSIYKLLCRKTYQHKFDFKDKTEKPHYHPWSSGLISMQLFDRYDLDAGFTNRKKFKFVEFTFSNYTTMRKCAKMIRDIQHPNPKYKNKGPPKRETNEEKSFKANCLKVKLYESNIDPMLRFMHLRDVQATGWVVLKAGTYKVVSGDNKESRCQIETSVHWKKVEPDNEDNTVAPIRQASFDIECISHDRKFPKPEDLPNKVIQIATAIKDYGDKDFTRKHILALGPCNEIEGSVVEVCATEKELLVKWAQLLQKLDPDIIIGYNIFGFDLNYIMVRAEKLGCLDQFAFMAKLKNYRCFVQKKQLKSKAYGANYYLMVEMPGRFQLDLYPYIKKEMKLVSYKLGFVAETIIGDTKHDITPKEISDGFESGDVDRITRIAAYCVQDTLLPQLIIDKMNILISLIEMGKVTYVPLSYLINRGQQIKVFSNFAKTARQYGYILPHVFVENQEQDGEGVRRMKAEKIFNGDEDDEDEEEDEETYEGATVLDPQIGFYDEPIACLDFMSLYPTIEIDWNLDFASLVKDYFKYGKLNVPYNSVFIPVPPPDECPEPSVLWAKLTITLFEATNRIYLCFNGNVTEEERKEIMPEFTTKLAKFQGYRMESEAQYVSYVHRTHDHDFQTEYSRDTSPQWSVPFTSNSMKWLYRTFPGAKTRKLYLWGQNFQGLLPKVLVNLLGARSKAKKQMEAEADPFMKSVYDQKQLALKVCCNSVYGFCGATATGMLPCKPVAECTTTIGRWQIEKSRDFSENIENFRQIMKYDSAFPITYPYICRFFDSSKPVKEQEKFWIADVKKVLGMYKLSLSIGSNNATVWDTIHSHFKENWHNDTDRSNYSQTYDLALKSSTTFEIYTTESFSAVDSITLRYDIHSDKEDDIMYSLNTRNGKIIPINYYDPQHKITMTHTDDKGYSANVKYGDSVTGDTPILCKFENGTIGYRTIDNLTYEIGHINWIPYGNEAKEQCIIHVETWTERGWTKINRIIRHKTDKEIFRIVSHSGCVDVTSDHSLLNENAKMVKPSEVKIGDTLLHTDLPKNTIIDESINPLEAYSMGFFWADGSCGIYDFPNENQMHTKYSWAINNQNLNFLNRAKNDLEKVYPTMNFKILETMESSNVYKLVPSGGNYGSVRDIVIRYRNLFYDDHTIDKKGYTYKRIPECILNGSDTIKRLFMEGYYDGDGDKDENGVIRFDNKGKIGSAGLYKLQSDLGYKCSINTRKDKPDVYRITCTKGKQRKHPSKIKKIQNLGVTTDYVYDLETENNHFSAGIGRMIVHNTDSIFTKFEAPQFPDLERKIAYNMICGSYVADRITDYLRSLNPFKDDSEKWTTLQFEKVYGLLLLFSKKRYAGTFYGCNPKKYSYIDKKGVALKRRDFCILVKEVYYDCLKILFNDELGTPKVRLDMAIAKARGAIDDLLNHRVPIEKLELSNLLNDEYKVREQKVKKNEKFHTFSENNVFMNDMVVIDHHQYGLVEGKVVAKRVFDQKNFFNRSEFKKPIDVYLKLEKENGKIEFEGKVSVEYIDIKAKSGFIITLKKILDPLTDERELALVSQSHVRLARKMFLRDPGSAPASGERVPSVYVEIEDNGKEVLQWQKAEHPAYAKEHNMKLDVLYYLEHQLRKPIKQIFSLIMKDPDSLFDGLIKDYKNKQQKQNTIVNFFKPLSNDVNTENKQTSGRQTKRRKIEATDKKRKSEEIVTSENKKSKTESICVDKNRSDSPPPTSTTSPTPRTPPTSTTSRIPPTPPTSTASATPPIPPSSTTSPTPPTSNTSSVSGSIKTQGKQLTGSNVKQTGLTGWLMSKK